MPKYRILPGGEMDDTSYSTAGFADRGIEQALDIVATVGFPQVEVLGRDPHLGHRLTGKSLSDFLSRVESRGLTVRTMHAPSGRTTLGTTDKEWRKQEIATLRDYILFLSDLGGTDMVIHPIPNPIFVENAYSPETVELVKEGVSISLDKLVPVAQDAGVRINLENLPYHCDYPYRTMAELRPLVDPYPSEHLGLILDTGHVGVLGNEIVDEIRSAGPRLCGTHLHDVEGTEDGTDHRGPTRGFLNWDDLFGTLEEIAYQGPYTFETSVPAIDETPEELSAFTRHFAVDRGMAD
jgi:sugar phosphate isomerase/epimerase